MLYLVLILGLLVALKLASEWALFQRRTRQITVMGPGVLSPPRRRQVRYDDTPILASEDDRANRRRT